MIPKRMRYQPEQFFLRSAEEMKALFSETPEAVLNTCRVAEQCNLQIDFGRLHYPVFGPPEGFTREGYLRQMLAEGLARRYGIHARVVGFEFAASSASRYHTIAQSQSGRSRHSANWTAKRWKRRR